VTFTMLLREIIGQLKGEACAIRRKDELLEEFNRILFETVDEEKRVLVFIDEGDAFKPVNLESLRLLTNMQEDDRNLFTIILAGQPKLAKMLESPARANLFQRIGVYCRLERMENWETVRDYIEHRCERSGRAEPIFTDEAVKAIYRHSENGIPRLVNKICKLALKAGETNQLYSIGPDIIENIGARFERFTRRKKTETSEAGRKAPHEKPESTPAEEEKGPAAPAEAPAEEPRPAGTEGAGQAAEEPAERAAGPEEAEEPASGAPAEWEIGEAAGEELRGFDERGVEESADERFQPPLDTGEEMAGAAGGGYYYEEESAHSESSRISGEPSSQGDEAVDIQVCLDRVLRPEVLARARSADERERARMAGQLAAQEIKNHPEFVSKGSDPVVAWQELKREILSALAES